MFAQGLNLVSGIEVGYGGVFVGAAPELLFIPDRNHDDKADGPPVVLLDGFGFQDTHEVLNSFLWGPDGWLYGNQGVFNTARIGRPGVPASERPELRAGVWRYHPVRHVFEVFAHGGSNPWGLDYDEHGQLFMTHCRSYWGKGPTTHVIEGGHFWNQVNANYAPFIVANPPRDFPEFRNYLLSSARYDHGAGGAGARGSDAIYGGHSHVGTMIYLGDNWPDEFRGHLFTHNLGGHQINHEINRPLGSGYNTVSAGHDMLFCTDPKYVAVDLQYGPDGAVYFIDWYDQQHCHNPNAERWDRSNGRVYRMEWQATYKPVKVDLSTKSDLELVELQSHKNQWFARTARRLLQERYVEATAGNGQPRDSKARERLVEILKTEAAPTLRLNALWAASSIGLLDGPLAVRALRDRDEFVRAWAIQLGTELHVTESLVVREFLQMAKEDPSPVVRRYLASAAQRLPENLAWRLIGSLAQHGEDKDDRNIPDLLWQSTAMRWSNELLPLPPSKLPPSLQHPAGEGGAGARGTIGTNSERAFVLARETKLPQLTESEWIYWFAATQEGATLNRAVSSLDELLNVPLPPSELPPSLQHPAGEGGAGARGSNWNGAALHRRLAGLWLAMEPRANVPMPAAWNSIAPRLYASKQPEIQRLAEQLAAAFGDATAFPRLRETLANARAEIAARQHAFAVLSRAQDRESLPVFVRLLDDKSFRTPAINLLPRFDSAEVSAALLARFMNFSSSDRAAALAGLTSRASFALALLDAVAAGQIQIPREQLTAYHVTRLTNLKNPDVNKRVAAAWGRIQKTSTEKQAQMAKLEKIFNEAPLWAYNAGAGRQHFQKLCASCHRIGNEGARLGPELTGAGQHGIRYFLENIIDPDAVIGADFQATRVETKDGDVLSGLLAGETASAVTLRTTAGDTVVPKSSIKEKTLSEKSLMPEALLDSMSEREQIELLKFLTTN